MKSFKITFIKVNLSDDYNSQKTHYYS